MLPHPLPPKWQRPSALGSSTSTTPPTALGLNRAGYCAGLLAVLGLAGTPAYGQLQLTTNLQFRAEASLKETYDSNVYIQDKGPDPANVAAAKAAGFHPVEANKSSFVTSVQPKVGFEFKPAAEFNVTAVYAPDVNFFHSASSEDFVAHRGTLNMGGKIQATVWELLNTGTYIDGNNLGPTFARPEDVPAIGGIPLRDRRAAFVFRNSFRLTQPLGGVWFIRPVASTYIHDFKTDQFYTPPALRKEFVYENYHDRQDINGGLDVGYRIAERTDLVLGYRYGQQDQFKGPSGPGGSIIDSPFDSAYHRVLIGVEGSPFDWLKLGISFGPDIRQFDEAALRKFATQNPAYAAFNPDELLYYVDASMTLIPTKSDSILLKTTRFEQPAFSSFSVYEDVKSDLLWRHKFNDQLSATAGITLYIGAWQPPVNREDWVWTPNAALTYAFTKKLSGELAYSYDFVESKIPKSAEPLTESHEFTRHLATIGVKYSF